MRRIAWIGLVVLLAAAGIWLVLRDQKEDAANEETAVESGAVEPSSPPVLLGTGDPHPKDPPAARDVEEQAGSGDIRYSGTVVDEGNEPVPGATVVARFRGRVLARVTSDNEGAYAFRASFPGVDATRYLTGMVAAAAPDGRAGFTLLFVGQPTRLDQPPLGKDRTVSAIVLRGSTSLDVRVTTSCPGGLPATVWVAPTLLGIRDVIAQTETNTGGHARIDGLPPGMYRVVAAASGCGRATQLVQVPQPEPETVELEVPSAHTLTVRVREKGTDEPIPGAEVTVTEYVKLPNQHGRGDLISVPSVYTTDAGGAVIIEGLGGHERLTLVAAAEGFPSRGSRGGQGEVRVEAGAETATINLQRARTIRWPLEDKGQGVPPDGTAIELRPYANSGLTDIPSSGVIDGGELVVEGWAPGWAAALAYAEGFGAARLHAGNDQDVGTPTGFYPLRRIELIARNADGSPAQGLYLSAYDGGNNRVAPPVVTDAEGRAVLAELYGGEHSQVNCKVWTDDRPYGGWPLGSVNLSTQDGRFEFTVPEERLVRVTVRVNGGLPPDGFRASLRLGTAFLSLEPDERGLCEVKFQPVGEGPLRLYAQAQGYKQAISEPIDLGASDPLEASLDFVRLGEVRIRVLLPEDGRNKITVQRWDAMKGAWPYAPTANMHNWTPGGRRADGTGWVTLQLEPGRYRALDAYTGKVGEPFDVALSSPASTTLDLRKSGWVRGRVVPPTGYEIGEFTVGVEGAPIAEGHGIAGFAGAGGLPGSPVNRKDGSFWYRVAGDGPVTLRVFHPTCRPHPTKGRITVSGPQEGIELHAVEGARTTVRFEPPLRIRVNPGRRRVVTVRLYKGAVSGEGTRIPGMLEGDGTQLAFGGYDPGRYTVWIDTVTAAPLVLRGVDLTGGDVDLGTHAPSPGSRLIVHVKVKDGQTPPRMALWATGLDEPTIVRGIDGTGQRIVLDGLTKGRFQVSGSFYAGMRGLQEEITFDGEHDVERTIDLR